MNEENKAFELTDEDLKQVSGGIVGEPLCLSCPGDCNGTKVATCGEAVCPMQYFGSSGIIYRKLD